MNDPYRSTCQECLHKDEQVAVLQEQISSLHQKINARRESRFVKIAKNIGIFIAVVSVIGGIVFAFIKSNATKIKKITFGDGTSGYFVDCNVNIDNNAGYVQCELEKPHAVCKNKYEFIQQSPEHGWFTFHCK